jgi:hypothetical protein
MKLRDSFCREVQLSATVDLDKLSRRKRKRLKEYLTSGVMPYSDGVTDIAWSLRVAEGLPCIRKRGGLVEWANLDSAEAASLRDCLNAAFVHWRMTVPTVDVLSAAPIGSARKDCAPPPAVLPATGMCYSGGLQVKTLPLRLPALPMPSGVVTFPVPFKPWSPRE